MIKTLIAIEFYKTHFKKPLLIQKFKQKKLKIPEKNYNDNEFANHQTTRISFKNNDSDSQNVFEIIKMSDNDENKNASNNIHIKKKTDLLISIKNDLKVSKKMIRKSQKKMICKQKNCQI